MSTKKKVSVKREDNTQEQSSQLTNQAKHEQMLSFTSPLHIERYERLKNKAFCDHKHIVWSVLKEINLEDKVASLISHGSWDKLFGCGDEGYAELTLEVLSTFTINKNMMDNPGLMNVEFRMMGEHYSMTLGQFSVYMGLYDNAFVSSPAFGELAVEFPMGTSIAYWRGITDGATAYEARKAKATSILRPELRVVQHLISHTIAGRALSNNVVGKKDLLYLYSMTEHVPLNLGLMVAQFLLHQAENTHVAKICGSQYITQLAKVMGVWDTLPNMKVISRGISISLNTLVSIHIIRKNTNGHALEYVLIEPDQVNAAHQRQEEGGGVDEPQQPPIRGPRVRDQSSSQARGSFEEKYPEVHQYMVEQRAWQRSIEETINWMAEQIYHMRQRQGRDPNPTPAPDDDRSPPPSMF